MILYAGQDGCTSRAPISVGTTGRWKVWTTTIVDGKFGKGCSMSDGDGVGGADIALRSAGGQNIAISTVEIYDPSGRQ